MRQRLRHWKELAVSGVQSLKDLTAALSLFLGGSIVAAAIFGVRNPAWGVPIVLCLLLVMVLEGAHKMGTERDEYKAMFSTRAELARRCLAIGGQLQSLVVKRWQTKPRLELQGTPDSERVFIEAKQMQHDLQTKNAYEHNFSADVFQLLHDLRTNGYLESDDITSFPEYVADIDRIGERLEQIGVSGRVGGDARGVVAA